jgi:hypothetical protein
MGCRKNYRYLTPVERDRLVQALYHLKGTGVVDQFANDHDAFFHAAHHSSHFLPWHREFLRRFEDALRTYQPDITIPYWDSTVDTSPSDPLWASDFMGQFDSAWGLGRNLGGGSLAVPRQVQKVSRLSTYSAFWDDLEMIIHNPPHIWVGGEMARAASPGDPVFYLHHCWIDLLWAHWQLLHPDVPFVSSGVGRGLTDAMDPWATTPADVIDHRTINLYLYPAFDTIWESTWTAGWTAFMPFMLNAEQHYLAYKKGSGDVDFDRIRVDGRGVDTIWEDTWAKGWTTFMPFVLNREPHYLAYKSGTGDVDIDRIKADGQGVETIWEDTWTTGWTSFVPFLLNGHPHFLAYKVGTGRVAVDRIRDNGLGVDTIWEGTWTSGWTTFMPFVVNGRPYYLAYKKATGDVDIDRIKDDGLGVDTIWEDTWTSGWTSFVPFLLNGHPHYLAYKVGTGRAAVDRVKDDGLGVDTMWEGAWTKGWTSFVPFQLQQRIHHLAYKLSAGSVDVDTIHMVC